MLKEYDVFKIAVQPFLQGNRCSNLSTVQDRTRLTLKERVIRQFLMHGSFGTVLHPIQPPHHHLLAIYHGSKDISNVSRFYNHQV